MIKLKGIYLVCRWIMDDERGYEVASYALTDDNRIIEGLSTDFRNKKQDLRYSKKEALYSIMENYNIDFKIENEYGRGKLKAKNLDGSDIKLVFEDIGGRDIRAGFPTGDLVRYYLGEISDSFECRECGEVFSEESGAYDDDFVCDECTSDLQTEIDNYPDVDSLMSEVTNHLIANLAYSNNLDEIAKEDLPKVKQAMRKYAEEEFEEEKEHFLEMGHNDESYVEFFFYPFFNQDNFDIEEIRKL